MIIKYPNIKVKLTGQDGNAFNLIGLVRKALAKNKIDSQEITNFTNDCKLSESYDDLLIKLMTYVEVI